MNSAATEKPATSVSGVREKKPRKSESVKDRPKGVEQLSLAIQQNRLDNRTLAAKQITQAREVISAAPLEASKALCIDTLAQTAAILTAITSELSRPGVKVLDDSGNLNPLIGESLFRTQDSMRRTISTLMKLEGKGEAQPGNADGQGAKDIAGLILEVSSHEGQ